MWEPVAGAAGRRLRGGHPGPARATAAVRRHRRASPCADLADGVATRSRPGRTWSASPSAPWSPSTSPRYRPELVRTLTSVSSVCRRTPAEREAVLRPAGDGRGRLRAATVAASLQRWYDGTGVAPAVVERTRATLLANDVTSFLSCYRVFATGDAEIGPELGAHLASRRSPSPGRRPRFDAGDDPAAGRRAPGLPSCHRPRGPAHASRRTAPRVRRPLTTFIEEDAHV